MADIKIYSGKGYFTGEEETVEYTEEELAEMGNPPTFSTVSTIPGRANRLRVKLTNLRVVFKIRLYDNCKKYITTVSLEAVIFAGSWNNKLQSGHKSKKCNR